MRAGAMSLLRLLPTPPLQLRGATRPSAPFWRCLSTLGTAAAPGSPPPHELQLTLALLKPSLCAYQPDVSAVLKQIKLSGLELVRSKRLFWKSEDAHRFYAEHRRRFYYDRLVIGMTSGPSMALALAGPDAIKRWRAMLGPTKAYKAKWEQPHCLRARYGLGDTRNAFHGSDSPESAQRELAQVFEGWDTEWWLAQRADTLLPDSGPKATAPGL
ncbi:hypothetical protein ACQY0O_006246 [Thecaphora frezii]